MDPNWAEQQLQTIRTLMERSAIYRRALAPIMIWNGLIGVVAGIAGWKLGIESDRNFIYFWNGAAVVGLIGSFLLVRRQALKDSEPFWSPPTRRVGQALLPPFFVAAFITGMVACIVNSRETDGATGLATLWILAYGCAANAAGFFMTRGIKLFGWLFILVGCALLVCLCCRNSLLLVSPHLLMGAVFGGFHLAYGGYLYLTEKGNNAA